MNTQLSIWLCVAITLFIFVIEYLFVHQLKRSVLEKMGWKGEELSEEMSEEMSAE